jgi:hypothetical protein
MLFKNSILAFLAFVFFGSNPSPILSKLAYAASHREKKDSERGYGGHIPVVAGGRVSWRKIRR